MAHNWYYSIDNDQHGPVTAAQLRKLAEAGTLRAIDLVRREDSENWRKASEVKGLFQPAEPPPEKHTGEQLASTEPPPLPSDKGTAPTERTSSVLGNAQSIAKQLGSAAKLAAIQAERTKILKVSLPKAYLALGRHIHSADDHRDEFSEIYSQLDDRHAKIEALKSRVKARRVGETLADKAKSTAATAKDKAEAETQRLQVNRLMLNLGQDVFEKHQHASGSDELVSQINELLSRSRLLETEIDELASKDQGKLFSAKRILITSGFFMLCLILYSGFLLLPANTPNGVSQQEQNAKVSEEVDGNTSQIAKLLSEEPDSEPEWVEINGNMIATTSLPDYYKKTAPPVSRSDYNVLRGGVLPQDVWELLGGRPIKEGSDMETLDSFITGSDLEDIHCPSESSVERLPTASTADFLGQHLTFDANPCHQQGLRRFWDTPLYPLHCH